MTQAPYNTTAAPNYGNYQGYQPPVTAPVNAGAPAAQPPATDKLWSQMRGNNRLPLKHFVGDLTSWGVAPNNFGRQSVKFHFDRVQVHDSDAPWPYASCDLVVNYSDSLSSGFGIFGSTLADALGIPLEELSLNSMMGHTVEVIRVDNHSFGNREDGTPMTGTVWRVISVKNGPAGAIVAAPVPQQPPSFQQSATAAAPVAVATPTAPAETQPPADPERRLLYFLHRKTPADFYRAALTDSVIQQNPSKMNEVISNTFIAAKEASGEAVRQADGTFIVVGMP